jgi:7-alpha-hydroxysteroid dehydrogenase
MEVSQGAARDLGNVLDSFRLDGRVALVTGAGRGLGRAMALALGGAGADLALVDVNAGDVEAVAEEARGLGRKVLPQVVDVGETGGRA